MRLWIAVSTALIAIGRARQQQLIFDHPTADEQQFAQDRYACMQESRVVQSYSYTPPAYVPPSSAPVTAAGGFAAGLQRGMSMSGGRSGTYAATDKNLYVACMEARGYRLVDAPSQ